MASTSVHKQAADTPSDATPAANTSQTENNGISSSSSSGKSAGSSSSGSNLTTNSDVSSSTNCAPVSGLGGGVASNNPFAGAKQTGTTRSILAPSRLGGFRSSPSVDGKPSPSPRSSSSILAPSKLFGGANSQVSDSSSSVQSSQSKFTLKPSILGSSVSNNPFAKPVTGDFEPEQSSDNEPKFKADSSCTTKPPSAAAASKDDAVDSSSEAKVADTSLSSTPPPSPPICSSTRPDNKGGSSSSGGVTTSSLPGCSSGSSGSVKPSVFGVFGNQDNVSSTPILSTNGVKPASSQNSCSTSGGSSFIFGQNLQSRAVVEGAPDSNSNGDSTPVSSDNLFSAAAVSNSSGFGSQSVNGGPTKSLETSSRELAEKESREKRKFEQVVVVTGEEAESNVLQMSCKVYSWVKGSWQERGQGILRLNDRGAGGVDLHSRLVVRTQGTLTIMLNTNVWSGMSVTRASTKSVRFTAAGADGQPIIYLVTGHPKDVELLFTSLEYRVNNSKLRDQQANGGSNPKKPRTEEQPSSPSTL